MQFIWYIGRSSLIQKKIEQGERKWSGGTLLIGVLIDFVDKVTLSKDFKEVSLGKEGTGGWKKRPGRAGWGCAWPCMEQQGCWWDRSGVRERGWDWEDRVFTARAGCGGPSRPLEAHCSLYWMVWEVLGRPGAKEWHHIIYVLKGSL